MRAAVVPAKGGRSDVREVEARSSQNHPENLYEAPQMGGDGRAKVMVEAYPPKDIGKADGRVAEGAVRFRAVITPESGGAR